MTSTNSTDDRGTKRARRGSRGHRADVGRDRVMDVALQLFLTHGYAGTSLKAVADELGISPPALYWYFPSKEDLYLSVLQRSMEDFTTYVGGSVVVNDDPVFKLSQLVRAHVTWQLNQANVAQAFDLTMTLKGQSIDIPEEKLAPVVKMQMDYVALVRSILREGVDDGAFVVDDIKTTAFGIITLCEYVTTWYKPGGELSVPAVANRYEGMVRRMVGVASRRTPQPDPVAGD
ncbi:TetR/AcrR family transcriptional regulator [Rhodococcus sp. IEGM 1307]|uniref:TetR/AcrR family transcriptional regulator n=1 Tax=Rhodococcus sp. IEGM 1307 TaxID=3047091 RepID=UPI0010640421|nr:TetR/AcrR family transcriptional regulator [Rhodococcus sp. IEGM 1307]MDI9978713.1 TetR/AcrR family transcriptional regulator [Rhodococcus sp. IEGM 1307]